MSKHHQDQHFDSFEPHTRLKHAILAKYLEAYLAKLFQHEPSLTRVLVVDGFAGRGKDRLGQDGSPVWIARCAATIRKMFSDRLHRAVAVDVVLVEADEDACAQLHAHMTAFGTAIQTVHGELNDVLPSILADASGVPAFVFLDPCGIKGLSSEQMSTVVSRPHSEVFVLVDDDGADRLLKVATTAEPKRVKTLVEQSRVLDMFIDNDERHAAIRRDISLARSSLKRTARPSAQHLTVATGGDEWRPLANVTDPDARRAGIVELIAARLADAGAPYIVKIPMLKAAGESAYTLLHASRSAHGRETMKEAVQAALNGAVTLGYDEVAVGQIRALMGSDLDETLADVEAEFSGQVVGWREAIRPYILRETDACPWQMAEVKNRLNRRGWKNDGKQLTYTVPAAPNN